MVFANTLAWETTPGNHSSILLDPTISSSSDTYGNSGRGMLFAEGVVEILNRGDGQIYIRSETFAHRSVDRIYNVVFLDQWDDKRNDWVPIENWDVERFREEEPNGELSFLMFSITLSGYPVNKYYRVRGVHQVEYNGNVEGGSTATHGVFITKD